MGVGILGAKMETGWIAANRRHPLVPDAAKSIHGTKGMLLVASDWAVQGGCCGWRRHRNPLGQEAVESSQQAKATQEPNDRDGMGRVASVDENEEFRSAIWSAIHAARRELGADFMATVWGRLQPGSKEGTNRTVDRSLLILDSNAPVLTMPSMVSSSKRWGRSSGRNLPTRSNSLREKIGRIKPLVREVDWLFVKALSKFESRSGCEPVKCVPSTVFWGICSQKSAWSWEGMEALVMGIILATNLLRVGEAVTLLMLPQGLLGFMGEKSRPSLQRQEVGLLAKRWLELIDSERKIRGESKDTSSNFGSPAALEKA